MATPDKLINIETRHAVLLQRLANGEADKFLPFLRKMDKEIRARLAMEGATIATKRRLNALLSDLTSLQASILTDYDELLAKDLVEISASEAKFEAKALNSLGGSFSATVPATQQIETALRITPLNVASGGGSKQLKPFVKDWQKKDIALVNDIVRAGFYQGQTISQITQSIRGTAAARYGDGALARVNRDARTIAITSTNHASNVAKMQTWKDNDDIVDGWQFLATLDSRTSDICRGLDGQTYPAGKGPYPPRHPNCRSQSVAVLNDKYDFDDGESTRSAEFGPVDSDMDYYDWLKTQDSDFIADTIGPARAKLLIDGGLSADEFRALQLNKNFQPITLKEMKRKDEAAFEKAGL